MVESICESKKKIDLLEERFLEMNPFLEGNGCDATRMPDISYIV